MLSLSFSRSRNPSNSPQVSSNVTVHELAFAKRPREELYDLAKDLDELVNVAEKHGYADTRQRLRGELQRHLAETKDPRALGLDAPWDYYPYYGIRRNKDWMVEIRP